MRARDLSLQWKEQNPQFFKDSDIRQEQYDVAQQSILDYWKINNVKTEEIDRLYTYLERRHGMAETTRSSFYGWAMSVINIVVLTPLCAITSIFVKKYAHVEAKKHIFYTSTFLMNACIIYKKFYGDILPDVKPLIELFGGDLVRIPVDSEFIYDGIPKNAKYYRNAYFVTIQFKNQPFKYILFSNSTHNPIDEKVSNIFIELCKEQIGFDWSNVDVAKTTFEKLSKQNT